MDMDMDLEWGSWLVYVGDLVQDEDIWGTVGKGGREETW